MKIPPGAISYCPTTLTLHTCYFRGIPTRHTVRPDGTRDWLLIYTVRGSGFYQFPGDKFQSHPGDITLYRPGVFQDYQFCPTVGKWDYIVVHFVPRAEWLPWLHWPEIAPGLMKLKPLEATLRRRLLHRLKDMVRFNWSSRSRNDVFSLNALEEVLLWCDSINPLQASLKIDPRLQKAMDFLTANLAEPFSENA